MGKQPYQFFREESLLLSYQNQPEPVSQQAVHSRLNSLRTRQEVRKPVVSYPVF
jgi:hypothetical protein